MGRAGGACVSTGSAHSIRLPPVRVVEPIPSPTMWIDGLGSIAVWLCLQVGRGRSGPRRRRERRLSSRPVSARSRRAGSLDRCACSARWPPLRSAPLGLSVSLRWLRVWEAEGQRHLQASPVTNSLLKKGEKKKKNETWLKRRPCVRPSARSVAMRSGASC